MNKKRAVFSYSNLKSFSNIDKTLKSRGKSRDLRNLEAELGVERYKNKLLAEEIEKSKIEMMKSLRLDKQLQALQDDFQHLSCSVRRSRLIQDKQKEEIESLRNILTEMKGKFRLFN